MRRTAIWASAILAGSLAAFAPIVRAGEGPAIIPPPGPKPTQVKISAADCRRAVAYRSAPDVEYKPGVDVRGRKVAPADLAGTPRIRLPDVITFDVKIDFARYLGNTQNAAANAQSAAAIAADKAKSAVSTAQTAAGSATSAATGISHSSYRSVSISRQSFPTRVNIPWTGSASINSTRTTVSTAPRSRSRTVIFPTSARTRSATSPYRSPS